MAPAAVCLVLRQERRASFFAGAAIYVSVLRWLGWVFLTRRVIHPLRYALFAHEFFAGLALACFYLYCRSLLSRFTPVTFSLVEADYLFYALLTLHGVAAIFLRARRRWRRPSAHVLKRAALYVPFVFLLTTALWQVSDALNVQSSDAVTHAFIARVYHERGLYAGPFNSKPTIDYPAGFGAINATALAVAPLDVVQTINLQHVLLWILALYLVTGTLVLALAHPLPWLHSLPLVFVCFFPLYSLAPDCFYEAIGRQAGPPILGAACLLALLPFSGARGAFYRLTAVIAFLCLLAVVLNPSCAPFALCASLVATALVCHRSRQRWQRGPFAVLIVQIMALIVAFAFVIGADPYYSAFVQGRQVAGVDQVPAGLARHLFAVGDVLEALLPWKLVTLSPSASFTGYDLTAARMADWWMKLPEAALPGATLALAALAYATARRRGRRGGCRPEPALCHALVLGVVLWLLLRLVLGTLIAALSSEPGTILRLKVYTGFLLVRCELLVLFGCLSTALAALYLLFENDWQRAVRRSRVLRAFAALAMLLPYGMVVTSAEPASAATRTGFVTMPIFPVPSGDPDARVLPDDLQLVAWADRTIGPQHWVIAVASLPLDVATVGETHMPPYGPAQAELLYSKGYNFCFCRYDPHLADGVDDYIRHVRNRLDVDWCLAHGIRYFFIPRSSLRIDPIAPNRGLFEAVRQGRLRPIREQGHSAIYEVLPRPRRADAEPTE
jgi:hypothetical protein